MDGERAATPNSSSPSIEAPEQMEPEKDHCLPRSAAGASFKGDEGLKTLVIRLAQNATGFNDTDRIPSDSKRIARLRPIAREAGCAIDWRPDE